MDDNSLFKDINLEALPVHVAIIMDGNGRWAKQQGFKRILGHRSGVETIRNIVVFASEIGIKYLTLYAFSVENWARPKTEVNLLMKLLERYLVTELTTFKKNNIKFNTIGILNGLPEKVQSLIKKNYKETQNNTGLTLTLALNYSGRSELVESIKQIVSDVENGVIKKEDIKESLINDYLFTKGIPDPDLLIRTSGEMRISNFLLWQVSYSELWITKVLWPDFKVDNFMEAVRDYQKRQRRFGKI